MKKNNSINVLIFSASLQQNSLNTKLAALVSDIANNLNINVQYASMKSFDSPSFNEDEEAASGVPDGARELKNSLIKNDAFIIASPEYNGSMPGSLKNVLDWVSRFRPHPFSGHHAFLLSASPSMSGANQALWSLRIPLEKLGTNVCPDMFSLALAHEAFNEDGSLKNKLLAQRLENILFSFFETVRTLKS
jgi:chromate reductase